MKERGTESVALYTFAVMFNAQTDTEKAEWYLSEICRVMRTGGNRDEHTQQTETVRFLLEIVNRTHNLGFVKYIREMAAMLPHIDDDLREGLAEADLAAEIEMIEEHGFSALFEDLFATLNNGCDCEDCRLDLLAMECHILEDQSGYRPELLRLQKEFPRLYALHADFFNEALRARDTQKLLSRRIKALSKKGMLPSVFADNDESDLFSPAQPVFRAEPKIGRNDPCPCGSGKKYKKCCGR
jgi:hypothetical protein